MHADPGALPKGGQNWKQLFPQEDDEGAPCPAEDELALQDNGFLSKNEVLRNKVSRLTERLRKRYPTNNIGTAQGRAGWGRPGRGARGAGLRGEQGVKLCPQDPGEVAHAQRD